MSLCRLTYCSHAISTLNYQDLKDILEKSQKNNTPLGLTGLLCFGNGMFLQVLEGDRKFLGHTYNRIAKDQRHHDTEIIEFVEVDSRIFEEWSMKALDLSNYSREVVKKLSMKYSSATDFYPFQMSAKQCLDFLVELYSLMSSIASNAERELVKKSTK